MDGISAVASSASAAAATATPSPIRIAVSAPADNYQQLVGQAGQRAKCLLSQAGFNLDAFAAIYAGLDKNSEIQLFGNGLDRQAMAQTLSQDEDFTSLMRQARDASGRYVSGADSQGPTFAWGTNLYLEETAPETVDLINRYGKNLMGQPVLKSDPLNLVHLQPTFFSQSSEPGYYGANPALIEQFESDLQDTLDQNGIKADAQLLALSRSYKYSGAAKIDQKLVVTGNATAEHQSVIDKINALLDTTQSPGAQKLYDELDRALTSGEKAGEATVAANYLYHRNRLYEHLVDVAAAKLADSISVKLSKDAEFSVDKRGNVQVKNSGLDCGQEKLLLRLAQMSSNFTKLLVALRDGDTRPHFSILA